MYDDPQRIAHGCAQDMSVVPGVRVEDMGHKMGCNGVDNGKLWFDSKRASPSASTPPSRPLAHACTHDDAGAAVSHEVVHMWGFEQ